MKLGRSLLRWNLPFQDEILKDSQDIQVMGQRFAFGELRLRKGIAALARR